MKYKHLVGILFGVVVIQFMTLLYVLFNPIVEIRVEERPVYLILEHESRDVPIVTSRAI